MDGTRGPDLARGSDFADPCITVILKCGTNTYQLGDMGMSRMKPSEAPAVLHHPLLSSDNLPHLQHRS